MIGHSDHSDRVTLTIILRSSSTQALLSDATRVVYKKMENTVGVSLGENGHETRNMKHSDLSKGFAEKKLEFICYNVTSQTILSVIGSKSTSFPVAHTKTHISTQYSTLWAGSHKARPDNQGLPLVSPIVLLALDQSLALLSKNNTSLCPISF